MKMRIACMGLIAICTMLCACGRRPDAATGDQVEFHLMNRVEGAVSVLAVSWSDAANTIASTGIEIAGGGKCLETGMYSFELTRGEIENLDALKDLTVTVSLSDKNGVPQTLAKLALPSELGDAYDYELCCENGSYQIRSCQ